MCWVVRGSLVRDVIHQRLDSYYINCNPPQPFFLSCEIGNFAELLFASCVGYVYRAYYIRGNVIVQNYLKNLDRQL